MKPSPLNGEAVLVNTDLDRLPEAQRPVGDRELGTHCEPAPRRSKSLEVLIPLLYLEGVSTGDFEEALRRRWQIVLHRRDFD
jgi:hypothetical protein